jgi:hypothetical protein
VNSPLAGPNHRYQLAVEALASQDGRHFTRFVAEAGIPLGSQRPTAGEAPGAPPSAYLVMVDEVCSLILQPGENGITVRDVRLLNACHLRLTARVTPGTAPPDWLEGESSYLLFDGDAQTARDQPARYIPLDGMAAPDEWAPSADAPLDVLAVALGRSIERANTILACTPSSPAGTALVSSVTVRVGVSRFNLGRKRLFVTLSGAEGGADQFVELTLQSSFAAAEADVTAEEALGAAATVGAEEAAFPTSVIPAGGGGGVGGGGGAGTPGG